MIPGGCSCLHYVDNACLWYPDLSSQFWWGCFRRWRHRRGPKCWGRCWWSRLPTLLWWNGGCDLCLGRQVLRKLALHFVPHKPCRHKAICMLCVQISAHARRSYSEWASAVVHDLLVWQIQREFFKWQNTDVANWCFSKTDMQLKWSGYSGNVDPLVASRRLMWPTTLQLGIRPALSPWWWVNRAKL